MKVLFIDPSSKPANRGFAIAEDGRWLLADSQPYDAREGEFDAVAVEGQWANRKASRQSLMTLSFYAGLALGRYAHAAPLLCRVPVAVWKDALIPGFANAPKAVFIANARQLLGLGSDWSDDVVDAVGGAVACSRMTLKQLKKHGVK